MERHTFSINFWISPSRVNKSGVTSINVTITLNGSRTTFSSNKQVSPQDWDAGKQKVRGSNDTAKSINESLRQIRNRIYDKESELLDRGYVLTADLLKDAYLDKIDAIQNKTLCQLYDEYLESLSKAVGTNISDDTYYNYHRTLVLVKEYISKKYRRNDMALQELNYSFISDFDTFLRKDYKQRKNTAVKYLRCLKRVINVAIANRYLKFDPFLNFKVQREVVDKVFLTEEELRAIINKDFAIKRLERVRDIFIFCCFTGLSYSDVKTLDKSHFETDEAERTWIKKHRVKTGVLFRVPLLPIPKLILEKYKGGEHLLPVIDLSSTDAYLKEIADLCGINKRISFHTARFTFATTVTITNRISLEVVSKMMGHTNTRMTSHYAKIVDKYIGEEMDKLADSYANMENF